MAIARQLDFRVCITTNGTLLPRRGHALSLPAAPGVSRGAAFLFSVVHVQQRVTLFLAVLPE